MTSIDDAFRKAAAMIGCDRAKIEAVFMGEAAGKFLDRSGEPIRRFEPHKLPREHWPAIGFRPRKGKKLWEESKRISTSRRAKMYRAAKAIDEEATNRACSWGGPQIMGFNHDAAGFVSATSMVSAFRDEAAQIIAFAQLVSAWRLDGSIRAGDFRTFARKYNGPGQVDYYAARIAGFYKRITGKGASEVLRFGARGASVEELQTVLSNLGFLAPDQIDGHFGEITQAAVERFQDSARLSVDGVVGDLTWTALKHKANASGVARPAPADQVTRGDTIIDKVSEHAGSISAATAAISAAGAVVEGLPEPAQNAVGFGVAGLMVAGGALGVWFVYRRILRAA